jgi:hypothetical protein
MTRDFSTQAPKRFYLREIAAEVEHAGHINERGVRYSAASAQHMLAQRPNTTVPALAAAVRVGERAASRCRISRTRCDK